MPWSAPKAPKGDRGYGYQYQKLRKALLPSAYGTPCVRCGELMLPGQKLHLDHDDYDRTKLRARCEAKGHQASTSLVRRTGRHLERNACQQRQIVDLVLI